MTIATNTKKTASRNGATPGATPGVAPGAKNGKAKRPIKPVIWTNTSVRIGDLQLWDDNPRMSDELEARRIVQSWHLWGQVIPINIGPKYEVYDGHQRIKALLTVYDENYIIECRQSDRPLTNDERKAFTLDLHIGANGRFDYDKLFTWDAKLLMTHGIDQHLLIETKRTQDAITKLFKTHADQTEVDAEPQIDRAAELRKKWGVERGQIWGLGKIVYCPKCNAIHRID
jgi:hypothetical protein